METFRFNFLLINRSAGELLMKNKWQPMQTAPKDGSEVLLAVEQRAGMPGRYLVGHWMPGGHCIEDHPPIDRGWYFWNGSMFDEASKPTHWMPLPDVPILADSQVGATND